MPDRFGGDFSPFGEALWEDAFGDFHDPTAEALYKAAYFDVAGRGGDAIRDQLESQGMSVQAIRDNLRDYLMDEYDIDFDDVFDWDAWREQYGATA